MKNDVAVWAVDPFDLEIKPDHALIKGLMNWVNQSHLKLQPVYILPFPRDETNEPLGGHELSRYEEAAKKVLETYLKDLGISTVPGIGAAKVIFNEFAPHQNAVDDLLSFVNEQNSVCILVSSHGRAGVKRLIQGSFSENLLARSKCPVLFLTHLEKKSHKKNLDLKVIFATDFSENSKQAFRLFLHRIKHSHTEIGLFYSVYLTSALLSTSYDSAIVIPENYFPDQVKWAEAEGAEWVKLAQSLGIQTKLIVKNQGLGANVGKTILLTAKQEDADLIVMASTSKPFVSFVLGSVAQDVCRSNQFPIWIYGPSSLNSTS